MKRFHQRMLALWCAIILFMSGVQIASAADDYPFSAYIISQTALRAKASSQGTALRTLLVGEAVYVTGEQSGYYIVQYDGQDGYVVKSAVSETAPNLAAEPTQIPASLAADENYETLYVNSTGTKVKTLQEALSELGFYTGTANGTYSSALVTAVKAFQTENGLIANGVADAATQEALYEKQVKNSKGKKTDVKVLPPIDGYEMKLNDKGNAIITLKTRLKQLGYYTGSTTNNVFDADTKAALIAFQKKNGLYADGIAGEKTQAALFAETALAKGQKAASVTAAPTSAPAAAVYPYEAATNAAVILRKSASTNSARLLTIPKNKTISVLAKNGEFLKVSYNGKTGYAVATYVDVPTEYQAEDADGYVELKSGSTGKAVKALQQALKELKFYSGTDSGTFNKALTTAVKAYQKKNGFVQTGIMTAAQQKLLFEGRPKNATGKTVSVKTVPTIEGFPLEQGDVGDAVADLQTALTTLGYYDGECSGTYDAATKAAVKAFQKAKGLYQDGKAGDKTLTAIRLLTTTPTPVPDGYVEPSATPLTANNVIVMQNGTRGVAVKNVQKRLVALGYYAIEPDGIYDSDDIAAVKAFQKKNGLTADGKADLNTQLILFSDAALPYATATPSPTQKTSATATPAPSATPNVNALLKVGSTGEDVTLLQERLKELNYFSGDADGIYGSNTATAVRMFQRTNGMTVDGVAGVKTLTAVYASTAQKRGTTASKTTDTSEQTVKKDTTLRLGDTGTEVKTAQQRLVDLGYMRKADGSFGPATYAAVLQFQQQNKLTVTGEIDSKTMAKLKSSSAKKAGTSTTATNTPKPVNYVTEFTVPKASEVRYANWYTEIRDRARAMPDVTIYDPDTGLHYKLHMFSFGKHADAEPPTAADTAIMNQVCGENSWTAHAVWVIFSDGRVYMGSTHSHGHTVDHTDGNDLQGHVCLHFPRLMEDAEATGPYAVSHQKAINLGWEVTQAMIQ